MNRIYSKVWNRVLGCMVVASEFAKVQGKKTSVSRICVLAVSAGVAVMASGAVAAATGAGPVQVGHAVSASKDTSAGDVQIMDDEGVDGTATGTNSAAFGDRSSAYGANSIANGVESVALGAGSMAYDGNSSAVGAKAIAQGVGSSAFGSGAGTNAAYASAIGYGAYASGLNSVALGANSVADQDNTVSVGSVGNERRVTHVGNGEVSSTSTDAVNGSQLYNVQSQISSLNTGGMKYFQANSTLAAAIATGANSLAAGPMATASGNDGVALGHGATASTNNSVALGAGAATKDAVATAGATIAGDKYTYAGTTPVGTVSVGDVGAERTVTNVAAGRIDAGSTDAVNGSQLYATNQAVDKLDARVTNVEGAVTNVTKLTEGQVGVFQVSAGNTTAASASGANATAGGAAAVASGANSTALGSNAQAKAANAVALGSGSVATRDNSVSVGTTGHERQVTNVAAGTQATDAANLSQVQQALVTAKTYADAGDQTALNASKAYTESKLTGFATSSDLNAFKDEVSQQFHGVNTRLDRVGAMGSAMAGMAGAVAAAPGTENRVSAAVGGYGGQGALAVGYAHRLPGNGAVLLGGSIAGGGESSGTAGVSFGW